ncbi:MAG: 3-hydroxyacyl-CoA dehydrogenase NAD-binding domain-containing protein [Gemmatimonadaceae bacterium]|nr:3-hydroxyacyl-CoA dehydrogenase NAD-binding domain-containing protein [Gemmatimonadaceae bacterium]
MGAGIAQVSAVAGHPVLLADASAAAIERARTGHQKALAREVEKGRLSATDAAAVLARLTYVVGADASALAPFSQCALVIEAIIEDLAIKRTLFATLEAIVAPDAVLASNTSSLSIAALAGAVRHGARVLGVHFFNPAPVMPLVEIIPALGTDAALAADVRALVDAWGKVTVLASDTPGFIVNRIARPFYGEALRIRDEQLADCATIDWALRDLGGFRMGPFELMDFIGNDVNYAVTCSVFEAMSYDARYRPSITQRRLVEAGWLGRKSGRGYYDYAEGATRPKPVRDEVLGRAILGRVLAMLVNEAVDAVHFGVSSPADIELAMTKGVNYPRGLLAWGDALGPASVLATLDALQQDYLEDRYRASVRLRRLVREGGSLLT